MTLDYDTMAHHPEFRALYRATVVEPRSDGYRWRLADWLERQGHPIGEWIKDRLLNPDRDDGPNYRMNRGPELFREAGSRVVQDLQRSRVLGLTLRRGMLSEVETDQATFVQYAGEVVGNYPVTRVYLNFLEPTPIPDAERGNHVAFVASDAYIRGKNGDLARRIDSRLSAHLSGQDFRTVNASGQTAAWGWYDPRAACEALSRACIRFGRRAAGLPPLPGKAPYATIQDAWKTL